MLTYVRSMALRTAGAEASPMTRAERIERTIDQTAEDLGRR
jgi:hypothetical protein